MGSRREGQGGARSFRREVRHNRDNEEVFVRIDRLVLPRRHAGVARLLHEDGHPGREGPAAHELFQG